MLINSTEVSVLKSLWLNVWLSEVAFHHHIVSFNPSLQQQCIGEVYLGKTTQEIILFPFFLNVCYKKWYFPEMKHNPFH